MPRRAAPTSAKQTCAAQCGGTCLNGDAGAWCGEWYGFGYCACSYGFTGTSCEPYVDPDAECQVTDFTTMANTCQDSGDEYALCDTSLFAPPAPPGGGPGADRAACRHDLPATCAMNGQLLFEDAGGDGDVFVGSVGGA